GQVNLLADVVGDVELAAAGAHERLEIVDLSEQLDAAASELLAQLRADQGARFGIAFAFGSAGDREAPRLELVGIERPGASDESTSRGGIEVAGVQRTTRGG